MRSMYDKIFAAIAVACLCAILLSFMAYLASKLHVQSLNRTFGALAIPLLYFYLASIPALIGLTLSVVWTLARFKWRENSSQFKLWHAATVLILIAGCSLGWTWTREFVEFYLF